MGPGVFRQSSGGDVHVAVDEHRLDKGGDIQLRHAAELSLRQDLTVHHAVTGVQPGQLRAGPLESVEHHLSRSVSDGVDGNGHIVPVGGDHQPVQLCLLR